MDGYESRIGGWDFATGNLNLGSPLFIQNSLLYSLPNLNPSILWYIIQGEVTKSVNSPTQKYKCPLLADSTCAEASCTTFAGMNEWLSWQTQAITPTHNKIIEIMVPVPVMVGLNPLLPFCFTGMMGQWLNYCGFSIFYLLGGNCVLFWIMIYLIYTQYS